MLQLPSCLFFTREGSAVLPNAGRSVTIPLRLSVRFHSADRPETWFCNATALTPAAIDSLLQRQGRTRATATGPAPWYGLPCAEAAMSYVIGPTLDTAATVSPRVVLAARAWSFDSLSDERFAAGADVVTGEAAFIPGVFGAWPDGAASLPQPAQGLTVERMPASTAAHPPLQAGESLWAVTIPASSLPAHFVPAGRAHVEVAAAQVLVNGAEDAFPSVLALQSPAPAAVGAAAPLPAALCCGSASTVAQLSAWPPVPVRRPWPLLAVALDDASWSPPVPSPDTEAATAAAVLVVLGAVAAVGLAAWWAGRCGFMEEALGLEGRCARAYWLESQRLDNARIAERDAAAGHRGLGGSADALSVAGGGASADHASGIFADELLASADYRTLPAIGSSVNMIDTQAVAELELSRLDIDAKAVSVTH